MIKYNPKNWFSHIFKFHKSDTFFLLWKELVFIGLLTFGFVYVELHYFKHMEFLSNLMAVYSLIGFVLSLLLVFRTNSAYDRWWEGRKKWGELVNTTRNLAIRLAAMNLPQDVESYFARMISNYAVAMKEQLREGVKLEELDLTDQELEAIKKVNHKTSFIARCMYEKLHELKKQGLLTQEEFLAIDSNMRLFSDITGACERIKSTPIPYSYSMFLKKFIFIYVTTVPLAFINTLGYYSSLVAIFIFYVLVSIEVLAEEIEDPFGRDDNDLPTDEICIKIKANVKEILR
jgi:ion channel-forming bestrophin family protein